MTARAARLQRLHAADREARPGPADRLAGIRHAPRRPGDHVLPATPPGLGEIRHGRAAGPRRVGRIARSTSTASSGAWSTRSSWRAAGGVGPRGRGPVARVTDLATLAAELLPGAHASSTRGDRAWRRCAPRAIAWVRVMRGARPGVRRARARRPRDRPGLGAGGGRPGQRRSSTTSPRRWRPCRSPASCSSEGDLGSRTPPRSTRRRRRSPAQRLPWSGSRQTDAAALERSVIGFIVARGAELERQAALLEAELRRRALDGGDVGDARSRPFPAFLGRALALEGSRGEPIAVHVPADAPAAAADAARYRRRPSAAPGSGLRPAMPSSLGGRRVRVALPAADGGAARGRAAAGAILALGAAPAPELVRVTLPRVAALLALELAQEEAVRRATRPRASRRSRMPSGGPPWVVLLARQRGARTARTTHADAREATRPSPPAARAGPAHEPPRRRGSLEVRLVVAVDAPGGPDADGRIAPGGSPTFCIGQWRSPARSSRRATARRRRRRLARRSRRPRRSPTSGRVVLAARLPIYRMLGALHHMPDAPRLAAAILEPLLASRPDVRREHLATLRAYLERGGVGEAAAALAIHRNTVAYRLAPHRGAHGLGSRRSGPAPRARRRAESCARSLSSDVRGARRSGVRAPLPLDTMDFRGRARPVFVVRTAQHLSASEGSRSHDRASQGNRDHRQPPRRGDPGLPRGRRSRHLRPVRLRRCGPARSTSPSRSSRSCANHRGPGALRPGHRRRRRPRREGMGDRPRRDRTSPTGSCR